MRPHHPRFVVFLLATATAWAIAGCGSGPTATPSPTPDPSFGPVVVTDDSFCAALDVMSSEHLILRQIRLRPANRRALDDQFDQLHLAWLDMLAVAPRGLEAALAQMRWSVIDLGIAVEDYTTTSRFAEAAEHVLREDIAFARTLAGLRARTACPAWQPTTRPRQEASPGPSAVPSAPGTVPSVPPAPSVPSPPVVSPAG